MKTLTKLTIIGVAAALVLTGCLQAGNFNPFLGGTADAAGTADTEATVIDTVNTPQAAEDPDASPFNVTTVAGTLDDDAGQTIEITFVNGRVDATDGTIPGVSVYRLLENAGAVVDTAYLRDATIPYTATVLPNGTGSIARLTVDLSSLTVTPIEIAIEGATTTGDNGASLMNGDLDDVPGEADEDSEFFYLAVTGPATSAVGAARNPRAGIDLVTASPVAVATGANQFFTVTGSAASTIDVTGSDVTTVGREGLFTEASFDGVSVWSFNPSTLTWTEEAITRDITTNPGFLQLNLTDPVESRDIFQVRYDRYNIVTAEPIVGFIIRDTTLQNNSSRFARTDLLPVTGVTYATATANDGGLTDPIYIDVTFTGVGAIVESTLTQESVRLLYDEDNNGQDQTIIPWDYFVLQDGSGGANVFRFYFSPSFQPDGNDDWDLYLYPTIRDDNGTPDDASDDLALLDVTEQEKGVTIITAGDF